jgi:hypothetical protein
MTDAKSRLTATKIQATFNPSQLAKDGLSDGIVSALKSLNAKLPIKYAQYEADAHTADCEIYPTENSVVNDSIKVFSAKNLMDLAKAMSALNAVDGVEVAEAYLNTDTPSKPFIQLMVATE